MNTWVYSFHDVNRHSHPRAAFMLPEEPTSSYEDPFGLAKDDTGPTGVPLFESLRVKWYVDEIMCKYWCGLAE